ncbi:Mitochondrial GTPase 1 [Mycena venus]|uniref:Mitochondrial GTPase 1 n=1 Tax=Mycena venus TaxID=2733690 RepID=A0A8H6YFS0_9AGAR|nr:Mitochondrial GTPase 1 [Mycena venus]
MAVTFPHNLPMKPLKRARRTATTVLAGDFDVRPSRDVLTSLLNGVGPYTPLQRLDDDEVRRQRKREKKERERERKRARLAAKAIENPHGEAMDAVPVANGFSISAPQPSAATRAFWHTRPSIHIATMQRSVSVTPPPFTSPLLLPSTPASTPGPSNSSSTSRTSSKRPRTPDDYEDLLRSDPEQRKAPPVPRETARRCQERVEGMGRGLSTAVGEIDQLRCGPHPPRETNAQRQKFRRNWRRQRRMGLKKLLAQPPSHLFWSIAVFFTANTTMALTRISFPALPIPPSWFPGHMMKFTRMLPTLLTQTDVVLELRDSRLPLTSINRTLEGALQKWRLERGWDPNDPTRRVINSTACEHIVVFNKRDLVPQWGLEPFRRAMSKRFPDQQFFFASWQRPRDIKNLSEMLVNIAKKYPYAMELNVLVIGMPNVGKSTLLNTLRNMGIKGRTPKALQTGAHPGLTQALSTRLKLNVSPLVYAFDSPGVMLPFLGLGEEGAERGVKLALIAGIKEAMYDMETLASYLLYRLNVLNPVSPAYLELLPSGAVPTIDIEEFLEALAQRMGMVKKGASPDLRRAATYFVRWWREEGGLISASSALGAADPSFQGMATAAITHGWGFDLEWQLRADEIAGRELDHAALIQEKMEVCIDAHLADVERQELNENNISATQRKKQQVLKEQMQRKLKYEQKYAKR